MGLFRAVVLVVRLMVVLFLLGLCACGFAAASPGASVVRPKPSSAARTATPPTQAAQLNPVRLVIPALSVNASVESVGVKANGYLDTPTDNPLGGCGLV